VETELEELLFRNLSACVNIQKQPSTVDGIRSGCRASLNVLQCGQLTAVANCWKIIPLKHIIIVIIITIISTLLHLIVSKHSNSST